MITEIFLIIDDAGVRGSDLVRALRPLDTAPERPSCLWVRVYLRGDTGSALLHYCFSSISPQQLHWLGSASDQAGVLLLAPSALASSDQDQFYREVLGQFERRLGPFRSTGAAVAALVGEISGAASESKGSEFEVLGGASVSIAEVATEADTPRAAMPSPPAGARRLGSEGGTELVAESSIEVRYRRGDSWCAGRLRQLNGKGVFITTSTPPPLRDFVHLALRFGDRHVQLMGVVCRCNKPDNGGDVGFGATYFGVTAQQHEDLVALVRNAQAAGFELTPPPERAAVRFPVRWPMRLSSPDGPLTLPALDISRSGLFVGGGDSGLGSELSFLMPHDANEAPIAGRAAVARVVDAEMAQTRGLHRGVGVHITRLEGADSRRYAQLVGRVRRRATKHIVICAAGERARALSASLSSVGYAVSTSDDPDTLEAQWQQRDYLPDVAIFDRTVPRGLGAVHLERIWRRSQVVCLPSSDEPPKAIRITVDSELDIQSSD